MKIIVFAGMPFSGKSEAVKIAKNMNLTVIRMGDMIWDEVKNQKLELNDKNVGFVANEMRKSYGMDIWARKTLEKIKKLKENKCLIIDGVRNIEEINTFKQELGKDFKVIAIEASDETRFKRAMMRGRKDDSKDLELVKERDKRELSWGLEHVISSADIVIENEGSIKDFKNKINKIFD